MEHKKCLKPPTIYIYIHNPNQTPKHLNFHNQKEHGVSNPKTLAMSEVSATNLGENRQNWTFGPNQEVIHQISWVQNHGYGNDCHI